MIKVSDAIIKMISTGGGNEHDVNHFLKVWGFARTIGEAEGKARIIGRPSLNFMTTCSKQRPDWLFWKIST